MLAALLQTLRNDQLDWSLPAHRRGTLRGMDAAPELTRADLQRVLRESAGKGPAAEPEIGCSCIGPHELVYQTPSRLHQRMSRYRLGAQPDLPAGARSIA
ncbi:hypothetical protein XspCFBP7912_20150 [Xanthomonas sp. CFBP 7912]|nr:hypothetical protein XspCFBP7912_20150 [Xanthomonas sp. CFBP 7912]